MASLDELKKKWSESQPTVANEQSYDQAALERIFRARVKKHTVASMKYFWASFALQILVYALLSHVMVKYWSDKESLWLSLVGVGLYIPFTVVLMKKFKLMATLKTEQGINGEQSLYQYAQRHHALLLSFYKFKRWYEWINIPLSSAIGIILSFKLYVPGGVLEYPIASLIIFVITLVSCIMAIRSENKKSFEQPLQRLQSILDEFKNADK